ncbi:hypothetical protein [Pseudobacteriovorax antillogorgiicola]|uniref:Intracellular septation protein A n=1 Tax=Pseudobacteriovorax antillogorgiicola TaxID=1513793 RepID=A0A1Y6BA70_9BACT|nr:hypothetical protein [Pseudobacteriovorax antillogorgiicola]TCS58926.1 hypothetical protein EDD56_102441 [Pseudobacteriovorax antillogorgiicola]SME93057.1 hypothetical protein SAMN06296036_1022 [Pseudobacteriovorax antillogorgiicola]
MDLVLMVVVPPVLYVVIDRFWGMKAGIIASLVMASILASYMVIISPEMIEMIMTEMLLILGLGIVSIKLKDSRYFKYQPAIIDLIMASICAYYQWFATPIMVKMIPLVQNLKPNADFSSPWMISFLTKVSENVIYTLVLHAVLVAWIASRPNNMHWLIARFAIIPMLLITSIVTQWMLNS